MHLQGIVRLDSKRHLQAQLQEDKTFIILYTRLAHMSELESIKQNPAHIICRKFKDYIVFRITIRLSREAIAATEFLAKGLLIKLKNKI